MNRKSADGTAATTSCCDAAATANGGFVAWIGIWLASGRERRADHFREIDLAIRIGILVLQHVIFDDQGCFLASVAGVFRRRLSDTLLPEADIF